MNTFIYLIKENSKKNLNKERKKLLIEILEG